MTFGQTLISIAGLISLAGCANATPDPAAPSPSTYHVYFLGGQSNMDGYGFNTDLPDALSEPNPDVRIYHGASVEDGADGGGAGLWAPLQPGHGTGFSSDGQSNSRSDRFGPELSFAAALPAPAEGAGIAIVKFARGGTGLVDGVSGYGSWDPDYETGNRRNQYDNALTTINGAFQAGDIDGDGSVDRLVPAGILWMQGEADAYDSVEASTEYAQNVARLMDLLRAALRADDLPVVLGRIQDSGDTPDTRVMAYSAEVQAQQEAYAASDPCAAIVTVTEDFGFLPDGWHYRSEDYLTLGEAFADAVVQLQPACGPNAAR